MVSNERGNAYIFRDENNSELLEDLRLPPKTLLLVQETTIYKRINDENIEPFKGRNKTIFIVDAYMLNGDKVSSLEYEERVNAIRKFCKAVNRGIESIETDLQQLPQQQHQNRKRQQNPLPEFRTPPRPPISYYLHCAEVVPMQDLEEKFEQLKLVFLKNKCLQLAFHDFNFPDGMAAKEELSLPCQAVRFVQRYKANIMLCWSSSHQMPYLFDRNSGKAGKDIPFEVNANFFEHLTLTPQDRQEGKKDLAWIWSWQMDSKTGYGPKAILNEAEFEDKLTTQSLCNAIKERLRTYADGALTNQLM